MDGMHLTEPRAAVVPEATVRAILGYWAAPVRRLAWRIIGKYGLPNEATQRILVWVGNEPWKRTVLYQSGPVHRFPYSHYDQLEQIVEYRIPIEKMGDLMMFNGSLSANRTRGELAVCCANEELNMAIINLAQAIVMGEQTVNQAREKLAEVVQARRLRWPVSITQRLEFDSSSLEVEHGTPGTADPDHHAVRSELVRAVTE